MFRFLPFFAVAASLSAVFLLETAAARGEGEIFSLSSNCWNAVRGGSACTFTFGEPCVLPNQAGPHGALAWVVGPNGKRITDVYPIPVCGSPAADSPGGPAAIIRFIPRRSGPYWVMLDKEGDGKPASVAEGPEIITLRW